VRRGLILLLAVTVFAGPAGAVAASLGGITGTLGAGQTSVTACDTGFGATYTTVSGNVTAVSVTGIDGACVGGALSVRLTNSGGTSVGNGGPVTVSGGTATVSIGAAPDADLVAGIRVSIEGP
jgi:hypothetical protein